MPAAEATTPLAMALAPTAVPPSPALVAENVSGLPLPSINTVDAVPPTATLSAPLALAPAP